LAKPSPRGGISERALRPALTARRAGDIDLDATGTAMATLARDTARHGAVHPRRLVEQAVATERAGFDALRVSDHYQPWWEPGESAHAWVLLGAIGQATERVPVGTGSRRRCIATIRGSPRSRS
jgi:hypothetical protein